MPKKKSAHKETKKSPKKVKRATRKQINEEKRKWNGQEGGGPGRPKGSTLDKTWKLTPKQMRIAEKVVKATMEDQLFPRHISQLADKIGEKRTYVRDLLRRDDFQRYMHHLLSQDGILLEMSFWLGIHIGMQAGDANVLRLYAQMTGKIAKQEAQKLKVEIVQPDGERLSLPTYEDDDEIEDAEIIEENFDDE